MSIDVATATWWLIPCGAVPLPSGGWANDGATIRTFDTHDDAQAWMREFPQGCAWHLRKGTPGKLENHGIVQATGQRGAVVAVDACGVHPFYPAPNCPQVHSAREVEER